ncbi:hypothetical protein PAXINDRAFT_8441 [Paxillus involutus ATCC 200175]|nr:hypothetical protein PAXINDRAFT_8441 [Paxillus involutus ATCC 200175]
MVGLDIELRNERVNTLLRDDSHSALKGLLSFLKAPQMAACHPNQRRMLLYCCLAYLTFLTYLTYSVIIFFFGQTYFCLVLLAFLVYLPYCLVIFLFQDTFELRINVNDWHFDFSWNHIQQTPATASPVTWNSSTTTIVNPTPAEDLWPGHPTWNATTWNVPTVEETINNVVQQFAATWHNSILINPDDAEDLF